MDIAGRVVSPSGEPLGAMKVDLVYPGDPHWPETVAFASGTDARGTLRGLAAVAYPAGDPGAVPGREPQSPPPQLPLFEASDAPLEPPPPSRHPWSWLLRRVFAVEVSVCPLEGCSGRMRVVEIAIIPDDVARVLQEQPLERRAP